MLTIGSYVLKQVSLKIRFHLTCTEYGLRGRCDEKIWAIITEYIHYDEVLYLKEVSDKSLRQNLIPNEPVGGRGELRF